MFDDMKISNRHPITLRAITASGWSNKLLFAHEAANVPTDTGSTLSKCAEEDLYPVLSCMNKLRRFGALVTSSELGRCQPGVSHGVDSEKGRCQVVDERSGNSNPSWHHQAQLLGSPTNVGARSTTFLVFSIGDQGGEMKVKAERFGGQGALRSLARGDPE